MMNDDIAERLGEMEVKRNRTLADLEAVQAAVESVRRSMRAHRSHQDEINARFIDQLESDSLPEADRPRLYHEWNEAFKASIDEYNRLAGERERLAMQEVVLVRILAELDHQIEMLKKALS